MQASAYILMYFLLDLSYQIQPLACRGCAVSKLGVFISRKVKKGH